MRVPKLGSKKILFAVIVVLLLVGGGIVLHTHSVHQAQHTSGTVPSSKKGVSTKGTKQGSQKSTSTSTSSSNTKYQGPSASTSSVGLIAPFGTFISNHKPGQGGSPTAEQSVCNTTPGATCDIQFTNGGITKTLSEQTTNGNGAAYWSWDVKGGTLASGSWQVTAVAKINGQIKTTADPTKLEIQ